MKHIYNVFIITIVLNLGFVPSLIFAQKPAFEFKRNQTKEQSSYEQKDQDFRLVIFKINGIKDKNQEQSVLNRLQVDPNFKKVELADMLRCSMLINKKIDAVYVRELLKKENVDFDFSTLIVNDITQVRTTDRHRNSAVPESFPHFVDTGNQKADEVVYFNAKQKWIKDNPAEFEKIKHLDLD